MSWAACENGKYLQKTILSTLCDGAVAQARVFFFSVQCSVFSVQLVCGYGNWKTLLLGVLIFVNTFF
jgi:hypothetical protein